MATKANNICSHGLGGTLCSKCYPEHHTYLVILEKVGQGKLVGQLTKTFVCPANPGGELAVSKARRLGALELYKKMPMAPLVQEPTDTEPEVEV